MSQHFEGTSEGGEATVDIWLNGSQEISVFVNEECWKEGRPGTFTTEALASLPPETAVFDYELWLCLLPCLPIHVYLRNWRWREGQIG